MFNCWTKDGNLAIFRGLSQEWVHYIFLLECITFYPRTEFRFTPMGGERVKCNQFYSQNRHKILSCSYSGFGVQRPFCERPKFQFINLTTLNNLKISFWITKKKCNVRPPNHLIFLLEWKQSICEDVCPLSICGSDKALDSLSLFFATWVFHFCTTSLSNYKQYAHWIRFTLKSFYMKMQI